MCGRGAGTGHLGETGGSGGVGGFPSGVDLGAPLSLG